MFIFSILLTLVTFTFQATAPQGAVPVGNEPRHHVKFENKYVRVIDAIIEAGDTTLYHTHSRDNVPIAIQGGHLRTTVAGSGQPPTESSVEKGRTTWATATYTHQIKNLSASRVRFIDVEIISSPGVKGDAPSMVGIPGHSLVFENERVRAYRVILQPGESTASHTHGHSFLNVSVSGGEVVVENTGRKGAKMAIKPGSFAWFDGPITHAIKNSGPNVYEAIDVELK